MTDVLCAVCEFPIQQGDAGRWFHKDGWCYEEDEDREEALSSRAGEDLDNNHVATPTHTVE